MNDDILNDLLRQSAKLNESISRMAGDRPAPLFGDFAKRYLVQKLKNPTLRAATKRSFKSQIEQHLIPGFGNLPLDKIKNVEFLDWAEVKRAHVDERRRKLERFFNARKSLIEILHAARKEGQLERVPEFDNPDAPRSVGRVLEDAEVLRILRHTKQRLFRLFFFTLWKSGCRPREILKWEWTMIRWNEPGRTWIDIPARISKTDRSRSIPINPNVSRRLFKDFKACPKSIYVWPNLSDPSKPQLEYHGAWRASIRKARVKGAMPYDFRRTFITRAAARNMPLLYVAKTLDTSTKLIESVYAKAQADVMEEIVR